MSNAAQLAGLDNLLKIFGSFGGLDSISATGTVNASNAGKLVNVACVSAGQTISLPAASTVQAGGLIFLVNNGQPYTLSRSGADTLSADGSVKTSFAIPAGGAVFAVSNGVDGWLVSGPGLISQLGDLAASLAGSGYQKLPSGLIIQWVSSGSIVLSGGQSYSFAATLPISFPEAVLCTFGATTNQEVIVSSASISTSQVAIGMKNTLGFNAGSSPRVIAIGY